MKIETKFLTQTLENQVQEHIKTIIHYDQVAFISDIQGWFNPCELINEMLYASELWDPNHMVISRDEKKKGMAKSNPFVKKALR